MRIQGLHVEGFGIFHDTGISDLPPGVVMLYGANEAGKSTLLGFVKSILFGFPDGRTNENPYPPLSGGRHGGRLLLRTDAGEAVTVERFKGKGRGPVTVSYADGSLRTEEPSSLLVPGATRELFANIYAFSLDELHEIESLQGDAVRTVIYGASAGSAATALPRLLSSLEQSAERLFKPQGQTPIINRLLGELEEVRTQLRAAKLEMTEYTELCERIAGIDLLIGELSARLESNGQSRQQLEARARAWQNWLDLAGLERRLADLEIIVEHFPEAGTARLDTCLAALREQRAALNAAQAELSAAHTEHDSLPVDEPLLAAAPVILALGERKGEFQAALTARASLRRQIEACDSEIARTLGNLGPDWSTERLLAVDRSLFTREAINAFEERLNEARRARERAVDTESARRDEATRATKELDRARERLETTDGGNDHVSEDTLKCLRGVRTDISFAAREVPRLDQRLKELSGSLDAAVRAIGPEWTAEHVESFDTSVSVRAQVDEHERRLDAARKEADSAAFPVDFASETLESAEEAEEAARRRFEALSSTSVRSRHDLTNDRSALRSLRNDLLTIDSLKGRLEALRAMSAPASQLPATNLRPLAFALLGLAIVGTAALLALGRPIEGIVALLILGGAAAAVFVYGRPKLDHSLAATSVEQAAAAAGDELLRKEERVRQDWQRSMLAGMPSLGAIDDLDRQIDAELSTLDRIEREREQLAALDSSVERARVALSQRQRDAQAKQQTLARHQAEWRAFSASAGLQKNLAPRAALDVLQRVESAAMVARQLRDTATHKRGLLDSVDNARSFVTSIPGLAAVAEAQPTELLTAVDRFVDEVDKQRAAHVARQGAFRDYEDRRGRVLDAETLLKEAVDDAAFALRSETEATTAWSLWLRERGFPDDLRPATARDALQAVELGSKAVHVRQRTHDELTSAEERIGRFLDDLGSLYCGLGRPEPDEASAPSAVVLALDELRRNEQVTSLKARASARIQTAEANLLAMQATVSERERELAELLAAGDSLDEEEFRRRARAHSERVDLLSAIASAEAILRVATGHSDREEIRKVFAELTPESIDQELGRVAEEMECTAEELERLRKERAEVDARMRSLQAADSVAHLRAAEERLLQQIRVASREWGKYAVAQYLLDEAKRRFEADKQPAVIRDAARHFRTITSDRYENVIAPIGESKIEIVTASGERKPAELLSRGALEQLYLAIRFGYIANSKTGGETLPLVFDDILVNADPDRAGASIRALLDLAQRNQVLYFTCHPATVEAFRNANPSIPVVALRNGGFEWMEGGLITAAAAGLAE